PPGTGTAIPPSSEASGEAKSPRQTRRFSKGKPPGSTPALAPGSHKTRSVGSICQPAAGVNRRKAWSDANSAGPIMLRCSGMHAVTNWLHVSVLFPFVFWIVRLHVYQAAGEGHG